MDNKRVIIGSLATVVAAGAIGVNTAYAHSAKNSVKRDAQYSLYRDSASGSTGLRSRHQEADGQPVDVKAEHVHAMLRAQQLRKNGHVTAAKYILEDVGIELPQNIDKENFQRAYDKRNTVSAAVENGDWSIFQKHVRGKVMGKKINTRKDFDRFVEAQELRKQQRYDEAQGIMEQLGVDKIRI